MRDTAGRGFLLVDKERGWTSHDVVAKVRSAVGGKVGHAGTLDPMATGLLVLALGKATKLLRFVQGAEKEYLATAQFGVLTDSLDADGAILSRHPMPVDASQVEAAMERFRGTISQIPPMVSARRVGGTRLYELARRGEVVAREARPVTIHELELLDLAPSDYPEVTFRTVCSSGTYIRTLADDIAAALGGHAHLTALRRLRNGNLHVEAASSVAAVAAGAGDGTLDGHVISPWEALDALPAITVDEAAAFRVRNGGRLPNESQVGDGYVRVADASANLLAVYRPDGEVLVPEVVLP